MPARSVQRLDARDEYSGHEVALTVTRARNQGPPILGAETVGDPKPRVAMMSQEPAHQMPGERGVRAVPGGAS